ncbi:MAG TPA: hypothetical protein VIQ60_11990, partial [Gemmatimonadaceae bacterium]
SPPTDRPPDPPMDPGPRRDPDPDAERPCCDVCGVPALVWRKCKLVCENCGSVNKTCADL